MDEAPATSPETAVERPPRAGRIFHTPAAVTYELVRATGPGGDQDWMDRARARALDPAVFDEHEPWFFTATISTNRLDAYFTRMAPSSLRNYAAAAEAGVAFQDSHRTDGLERMLGRSLLGRFVGGANARTDAGFFSLRGVDPAIDSFERKMRAGLAADVSIGFYGGTFRCSICNRDLWRDYECPHLPGWTYPVLDSEGKPTGEEVQAFAWIEDANLAEASVVYEGATPGAALLAASRLAAEGRLVPEMVEMLRHQYRSVDLDVYPFLRTTPVSAAKRAGAAPTDPTAPLIDPNLEVQTMPPTTPDPQVERTTPSTEPGTPPAPNPASAAPDPIREVVTRLGGDPTIGLEYLEREITRLRPLASDGEAYRRDLVAEALTEGVRALGNGFATDTYRAILTGLPLDGIKRMRDDWRTQGDERFAQGRRTTDPVAPSPPPPPADRPADAYRA